MGSVFSCCGQNNGDAEERVPLKANRGGSGGVIVGKNDQIEPADNFVIDPEIQKFLDNFSSDDGAQGTDDNFEDAVIQAE